MLEVQVVAVFLPLCIKCCGLNVLKPLWAIFETFADDDVQLEKNFHHSKDKCLSNLNEAS
jgi:hypothetical protein